MVILSYLKRDIVNGCEMQNTAFMNETDKQVILNKAQQWFLGTIAKALVYPRVLGASITTSFGTNVQKFISEVLSSFGSTTSGIDIEFEDQVDGKKKYCQLKAGPNTINRDDVQTIHGHFGAIQRLSRTNNLRIPPDDWIIGVLYGEHSDLSGHYLSLENINNHPVIVGQNFWHRLTGDDAFYHDLIAAIVQVADQADGKRVIEETIQALAATDPIIQLSTVSKN
ncbi:MAG: PmeII family type II restriction endonuclease [Pontiella sp.]